MGDESTPAGAIVIFELDGPILALYPRTELAKDANIPIEPPTAAGFSIGHIVVIRAKATPVRLLLLHRSSRLSAPAQTSSA